MNGGGTIVVGDVLDTTSGGDVSVSIILEVEPGRAADLAIDIEKNGGVIVDSPAPKFWGQVFGTCKGPLGLTWCIREPLLPSKADSKDQAGDVCWASKCEWKEAS
ncbi:unnamed protein product [Discosporangium mesarthrocarpum]